MTDFIDDVVSRIMRDLRAGKDAKQTFADEAARLRAAEERSRGGAGREPMTPLSDRMLRAEGGEALYHTSALYHYATDAVRHAERLGVDGVDTVIQILVTLAQHNNAVIAESTERLMRQPPGPATSPKSE